LVNCPEVQFQVLYDYPSCDGFPFLLVTRKGKVLGLVSIYPPDYYEDGIADWKELRDFLLRVADEVRAILESQNNDSAAQALGGGVRCQKFGKSTK
jgi:chromosome condensin MukBEF MukE localization factor